MDQPPSTVKRTKSKKTTPKKKNTQARVQVGKRIELEKKIFHLQQLLIDSNVSETDLKEAVSLTQPLPYLHVAQLMLSSSKGNIISATAIP
jgi:hypothetical protein